MRHRRVKMVEVTLRHGKKHSLRVGGELVTIEDTETRFEMSEAAALGPMRDKVQIVGRSEPAPGPSVAERKAKPSERAIERENGPEESGEGDEGDGAEPDVETADVDALDGVDFASKQARSKAAHFELTAADFEGRKASAQTGFDVADVEQIVVDREEQESSED